jgi:carboxypeptidase C (cathepsin A)
VNENAALQSGKDNFCASPVSKEKVVFPDSVAGRAKINYDMYSGYVNVTNAPDYLFYWFFGAQNNADTAPLIMWTNGGPGCTSMEGATTENGPLTLLDIKESCSNGGANSKCDYTLQLSSNTYAWNTNANLLYVDQPRNVGYSFGYGAGAQSSTEAAQDILVFYKNWLNLFPEFKGRKLIIAGESYGGHYIPAWSSAMIEYNAKAPAADQIPLAAVVIGNGCVNDTVQDTSTFVDFEHQNNLIEASASPKSQVQANSAMNSHIGYTPNYYDYRIQSISCSACYGYNYTAWANWFLRSEILSSLHICGDAGRDAFAGTAGGCISMGAFDSRDNFDYSGALAKTLEAGIPVTVYYGKTDTACQYVGGQKMADTISWKGQKDYNDAAYQGFTIAGVNAGQIKTAGGLTYIGIEGAGHMVPLDQPAASAAIIQSVLAKV